MNHMLQSTPFRRLASLLTFLLVLSFHFAWINLFPEDEPAQRAWLSVPAAQSASWWDHYWNGQNYWMGYSYALSIGFAVYALLLYASSRLAATGRLAIGGISLSGSLAVFGCFLLGCCGSPMLGVYLSLFGASFLPFAKPLVALLITLLIAASWVWLRRKHCSQRDSNCR
jgi:hypothetical protein